MALVAKNGDLVTPGTLVGEGNDGWRAGTGAYTDEEGFVRASVVGRVHWGKESSAESTEEEEALTKRVVSIITGNANAGIVPVLDSLVTCRVLKVNERMAICEILCVGSKTIPGSGFKGTIRKENVRSFEVDRVEMYECFRTGDIVRAVVASLGSAKSYELSTADSSLGVVSALSAANEPMVAVSFDQMRCPVTGTLEKRKVAKISP